MFVKRQDGGAMIPSVLQVIAGCAMFVLVLALVGGDAKMWHRIIFAFANLIALINILIGLGNLGLLS